MASDLTAAREALAAAHKMVADLCKRQGEPGWRRWEMSIPARPGHDPDLVIGAALDAGDALLAEVDRLTAGVADAVAERDHAVLCYNIAVRPDLAGPAMLDDELPAEPTEAMRVRSLHLRTAFWTLGMLAQAHPDAVNHLAFVLTMPPSPEDAPPEMKGLEGWRLEVAAIKPDGKGPSEMRAEAVKERDEALAEVARLRAELVRVQGEVLDVD